MNEDDIKRMVRESVELLIREEIKLLNRSPQDFQHFRKILISSLSKNHSHPHVLRHVESLTSKEMFGILHESWNEIKNELSLTRTHAEREAVWRNISQYYIGETIRQIAEIII
jgi:hypothetical protein